MILCFSLFRGSLTHCVGNGHNIISLAYHSFLGLTRYGCLRINLLFFCTRFVGCDVRGTTLSEVLTRTLNMTDLPLAVFTTPSVTVCAGDCESVAEGTVTFSDSFGIAWEVSVLKMGKSGVTHMSFRAVRSPSNEWILADCAPPWITTLR